MTTFFMGCALFGGTLLICQSIMTVIGLAGDHDMGGDSTGDSAGGAFEHATELSGHSGHGDNQHHSSSTWFFAIVTWRTVVAAIAFFGLAGMTAISSEVAEVPSLAIASLAGFSAMYCVHWLMRQLSRLRADGSVRVDLAVGTTGNVYLRIPAAHGGAGKIHVNLQNRTVELTAWTDQAEIPTGATVVVTRIVGPDSVEVAPKNV